MNAFKTLVAMSALACMILLGPSPSNASVYITYESVYTGSGQPESSMLPWLTAFFEDTPQGVLLTLSAPNLSQGEYASKWYFGSNLGDAVDLLSFTVVSASDPDFVSPKVSKGNTVVDYTDAGGFNGGGLGTNGFTIEIPFDTRNNNGTRFTGDRYSKILITGPADMGLVADDFHYAVFKSDVEFISVAHVQSIDGELSAWLKGYDPPPPVATPEPGTMLLLGAGVLGTAVMRRRRAG